MRQIMGPDRELWAERAINSKVWPLIQVGCKKNATSSANLQTFYPVNTVLTSSSSFSTLNF